jgi:hypothetical protein
MIDFPVRAWVQLDEGIEICRFSFSLSNDHNQLFFAELILQPKAEHP